MSDIRLVDGVVIIPASNIVKFAFNMAECIDGYKTWEEMESWHQAEINLKYGRYTEKEYEEVPQFEIDRYEQMIIELKEEYGDE
jgi:hypothetical protein